MSSLISHHELLFRPDYRFFTVRDEECDATEGGHEALARSHESGAAATEFEVYVTAAQDLLRVRACLEVWDGSAGPAIGFDDVSVFELACPSGTLQMSDGSGTSIGGIDLPTGPGLYTAQVQSRGRAEALAALRRLDEPMTASPASAWAAHFAPYDGVEEYLIRVWFAGLLPDDDDDEAHQRGYRSTEPCRLS
ncbi:hypothetical protein [Micromonospora sp. WMMD1155]|uniref:hypothetical protein n=1 Tax=Micromonospora sp. WMMD1155 TaxID=3016094 RepID=UPI002499FEAE|nr:hypothetical protein [Micromonospora sp. WMMD1155]WFE48842.1 hypothetical protein O7617_00240 [Micromonospora sp. WMMD1155]